MSSQRVLLAFVLLASVAVALGAWRQPNHVVVGSRGPYDYLLRNERLKVPSSWMQVVKAKKTFASGNGKNITMVKLLDQNLKGNGATATIMAGGPGFTYVTAQFKSKRGHSIDFIAELYGH